MNQPDTHSCPGGCGTRGIPRARLACKPCWFRLPRPLRREVDYAYRTRGRDPMRHLLAVGAASRWWRDNPPAGPSAPESAELGTPGVIPCPDPAETRTAGGAR